MKKNTIIGFPVMFLLLLSGCQNSIEEVNPEIDSELSLNTKSSSVSKVTGSLQVQWQTKGGKEGAQDKIGFVSFSAHDQQLDEAGQQIKPPKGYFMLSVLNDNLEPEREIMANVLDVGFSFDGSQKAWIFAEVIQDTKCEAGTDHSGGGCTGDHETGDDITHDEGCSGSHDITEGTDTSDAGHDEGCSHDDGSTTDEGGCSHDDGTTHDDGGCGDDDGSSGGSDNGGKGKECRVGQYIIVKMHDKGSPGTEDGISWKWYESISAFAIEDEPTKLCKKTILEGNLVVHLSKDIDLAYNGN